jgi:Ca2+-binding RTX toxin-like protein
MKQRTTSVLVAMTVLALLIAAVVGLAQATSFCGDTIEGTNRDDRLIGDRYAGACYDTIKGFGGDDVIKGLGFPDKLYGGDGTDSVYGGRGNDFISTEGDDVKDFVDCGPGTDTVNLPPGPAEHPDTYRNCEQDV